MPAFSLDVYGSTLNDKTHKGPNQGGNKSLLSYNSALGVPGYTGFIPGPVAVLLPIKTFEHIGRHADSLTRDNAVKSVVNNKIKHSEHHTAFLKTPSDTAVPDRKTGGYWIKEARLAPDTQFTASTTYREEMSNGAATAEQQLSKSIGLRCTIAQYESARKMAPRAQTADAVSPHHTSHRMMDATRLPTQRPVTAITSDGKLVGYQTTYRSMVADNPVTGGNVAAGRDRSGDSIKSARADEDPRYTVMPQAMPPGMYGSTTAYGIDFGPDCSDPMDRSAPGEKWMTRCTTSKDLSEGTTRATDNPPGYTGHVAVSRYNHLARAQSRAADERKDMKDSMLLFNLDQFSRSRVPHYTGYKPQAARNITVLQPSQGPPRNTTTGSAQLQGTKNGLPPVDHTHHNNSRAGIMKFFSSTGETVSDNGLSNAQEYYKLCKPGNDFKHSQLSKITDYGKPFNPRNSLV